ncbi:MAG: alpha/beta fold hydrolase [Deltaproteobacteria bacterium]|nr:alpha/beta fold hydrolase [Deltaproteobacteria bacterium]
MTQRDNEEGMNGAGRLVPLFASDRLALWEHPSSGQRSDAFLLVHGLGQHRSTFTAGAMPGELARFGRVILAELDGPDRATGARPTRGLSGYLFDVVPEAIARVRELPGVERVHYVGHSMGAYLGSALLAGDPPIRSLANFAAPLPLARGRPQIKLVGAVARKVLIPFVHKRFPMDVVLRLAKDIATLPTRGLGVFDLVRLGVPEEAPREVLRALFTTGVPESVSVMMDLAELAVGGGRIAGIDVLAAIKRWPGPIFSALGDADVFGSAACLQGALDGAGPRRTVLVERSGHSDLVIGRRARSLVRELIGFLVQTGAIAGSTRAG